MVAPILHWLPNAISVVRVVLVGVWVICAEAANRAGTDDAGQLRAWAATVLVAIGLSDVIDGWLARRFQLDSRFGANLDAFADKLAQVVLFTYLALRAGPAFAAVPLWFLATLIARDVILLLGYIAIQRRHGAVDAEHRWHGKTSSLLLFALLIVYSVGGLDQLRTAMLLGSTALLLLSTACYVRHGVRQFTAPR